MIKKSRNILAYSMKFPFKYRGKHIAVVDNAIVAVGKNRLEVYQQAAKGVSKRKKIGLYYLPSKNEILTAL